MSRKVVNIHDAKTHFSRLLNQVRNGEEIVIAKAGKPVAMLTPLHETSGVRSPGSARGRIKIADDFTAPLPKKIEDEFYR